MRELIALVDRHRRELLRRPAFTILGGLFVLLLVLVAAYARSTPDRGLGPLLGSAFLWFAAVGATSTGALPVDRSRGRTAWLRSLAPPAWKGRLAAALVGWLAVLVLGLLVGGLVAVLAGGVPLQRATGIALPDPVSVVRAPGPEATWGPALRLALPPADGPQLLEFEVTPQIRREVRARQARLRWRAGGTEGEQRVPTRGSFRLAVPAGSGAVELAGGTGVVNLRLRAARRLTGVAAPWRHLLGAAVLLALLVAAVVPVGVACSRFTSSATAGVLVMLLLAFGVLKEPVGAVFDVLARGQGEQLAMGFLAAVGRLVPDLPVLAVLGELGAGRAVALADPALWGGALVYTAVGFALVACPAPRRQEAEGA